MEATEDRCDSLTLFEHRKNHMNHTENGEVNDSILSSTVSDGKCVNGELFLNVTIALNPSREYKKI